ncbi:ribosomal maturation YjgA family protein [Clavibacter sp. km1a]|uniref:ribosomal maturation YjgA family protein n=1 Tax=Clavibacter sp. km1a TaxID=3459136 RepID=UPI0040426BD4
MRHSGDVDAFLWDEPPTRPGDGPVDAAPVVDRDVRLPDGHARRRVVALAALLAVVIAGMVVTHSDGRGLWPDLFYAAAIHLALIAVMPRVDTVVHGAAVLVWCTGIELLQITGWPAIWALHVPLCRLILGTGFDPLDLAAYALGVLLVLLVDRLLRVGRGMGDVG